MPGASAYFIGGGVIYTREARRVLMDIPDDAMKAIRSASEPYAQLLASQIRARSCNRLGSVGDRRHGPDAATAMAMPPATAAWPYQDRRTRVITLETGSNDRVANMQAFASAALNLLLQNLR